MAEIKRRMLQLSSGKHIKLFGNSVAIGKSLELGEGYAPNLLSFGHRIEEPKTGVAITNPFQLTAEEIFEIADYNMKLWLELKENIRRYGINSPRIFNNEGRP